MKRLAALGLFTLLLMAPAPVAAQHETGHESSPAKEGSGHSAPAGHGNLEIWKWANFLLLAGILGWSIGKNAGPFFASRSKQIRKDMIEAEEVRKEAEAKAADVDHRLANLQTEIEALRQEAQQEQAGEEALVKAQTAAEIAKIKLHAEQEIAAAGKAARMELKRYAANLAVEVAEQKIRARITPDAQDALVRGFVRDLKAPAPKAT
jgi:F-type H+-transporting ATPase subunit b